MNTTRIATQSRHGWRQVRTGWRMRLLLLEVEIANDLDELEAMLG